MRRLFPWLVSLVLTLAIAEVVARRVQDLVPSVGTTLRRGGHGPASDRLAWYLVASAFRGGGKVTYHPVLGWVPAPGSWTEDGARITVNAQGFRDTHEVAATKTPGRTRIVAVGDSFTFGSEGADGTIWTDRIEQLRPDAEVVNLGVFAYGLDQMWLRYREQGRALDADVVIAAFIDDDWRRTLSPFQVYARPEVPAEQGILEPVNTPLPTWEEERARIAWTPRLWLLAKAALGPGRQDRALAVRRSLPILDRFVQDVREDGAVPVLAWLPTGWDLDRIRSQDPADYRGPERDAFDARCAKGDVVCVDLTPPVLARIAAGDDVTRVIHYSEAGNDAVGRALVDALVAHGLLPAPALVATP